MSLDDLGNIGELVGSIGVVVSLVYLSLQIRNQNIESRASRTNDLTHQWQSLMSSIATDESLGSIWMRGSTDFDSITANEQVRFIATMAQWCQIGESMHNHFQSGSIDPEIWRGFDMRNADVMATPGAQEYWEIRKHWFSKSYQAYIDGLLQTGGEGNIYGRLQNAE